MNNKILYGAVISMALALSSCESHRHPGPMENAGRHVDRAADSVHDSAVRTEDRVENGAHNLKERIKNGDEADDRAERNRRY